MQPKTATVLDDLKVHGAFSGGEIRGDDRRENASWPNDSRQVVGIRNHNGHSECHGFPVSGIEAQGEPLDEYHPGCNLYDDHVNDDARCLDLLYILGNDRSCAHRTDCLVCMELAIQQREPAVSTSPAPGSRV